MGLDVNRLVANADSKAHSHGTGWCLRAVREALESVHAANTKKVAWAIQSVPHFRVNPNFQEVPATRENLKSMPKGTVIVIENPDGGPGHIEIARGDGTAVSDFDQKGMQVYRRASRFYAFIPKDAVFSGDVLNYSLREAKDHAGFKYDSAHNTPIDPSTPEYVFLNAMKNRSPEAESASKKDSQEDSQKKKDSEISSLTVLTSKQPFPLPKIDRTDAAEKLADAKKLTTGRSQKTLAEIQYEALDALAKCAKESQKTAEKKA